MNDTYGHGDFCEPRTRKRGLFRNRYVLGDDGIPRRIVDKLAGPLDGWATQMRMRGHRGGAATDWLVCTRI